MKSKTDGNLFTDIYSIKESLYGLNASSELELVRQDISEAIIKQIVPDKLRYILLKTTNYCNSNCEYCAHAIHRVPQETKFSMPHDIIIRTIEEASSLGVDAISISGGEPLLREDICEIVEYCVTCNIVPVLLTNGLLLGKKWDELGKAGLRYCIISFDSIDKGVYEKQRGVDFSAAMRGIEAAMRLREKYDGVELHVSAVLTKDNQDDFLKLLEYMNNRDIKVQISPYHQRENDAEDYSVVDRKRIEELTDQLIQMKREGYHIANSVGFLRHLPEFFCSGKVLPSGFKCKVGYTSLAIDTFMNVKPCWSYMFEPIGNLADNSLKDIWSSKVMQEYRERMLYSQCEGCWYLCTSEVCMMLDDLLS